MLFLKRAKVFTLSIEDSLGNEIGFATVSYYEEDKTIVFKSQEEILKDDSCKVFIKNDEKDAINSFRSRASKKSCIFSETVGEMLSKSYGIIGTKFSSGSYIFKYNDIKDFVKVTSVFVDYSF